MNGKTLLDFPPFDLDPAPREDETLNVVEDDLRASGDGPPLRGRKTGARLCILSLNFYLSFCVQRFTDIINKLCTLFEQQQLSTAK